MDILALGPVEVRLESHQYSIGGAKQQALLSRLVVARGKPVPVTQLCDEL